MVIDKIKVHLLANKNQDYQSRVRMRFEALTEFLDEHNFSTVNLKSKLVSQNDEFELLRDDLTEEGFEWVKQFYDKWLRALDRAKPKTSKSQFIESLSRLKVKNA